MYGAGMKELVERWERRGEIRVEHDSVQYVSNRKIETYMMKTRNISVYDKFFTPESF